MADRLELFIVEDDPIERGGFIAMLEDIGYGVAGTANNGKKAVDFVRDSSVKPDFILMDINLPEISGLHAAAEIADIATIPIVLVTGYKDVNLTQSRNNKCIFGYIQKPVDAQELGSVIEISYQRFLEWKQVNEDLEKSKTELKERKLIERAKGILMEKFGFSESKAMKFMQERSRNANKKLAKTAADIVAFENHMEL